jgi:hypothetical protein
MKGIPVETSAFLDYLEARRASASLAESLRDLIILRRDRAQRRALARSGALVPIPVPVDLPYRWVAS